MAKLTKRENQARLGPGKENTIFLQALIWAMRGEHRCESRVFFLEEEEETIRRVRRARQWLQEEKSPVTFRNLIRAVSALFPHEAEALLSMRKMKKDFVERLAQQSLHPLSFKEE